MRRCLLLLFFSFFFAYAWLKFRDKSASRGNFFSLQMEHNSGKHLIIGTQTHLALKPDVTLQFPFHGYDEMWCAVKPLGSHLSMPPQFKHEIFKNVLKKRRRKKQHMRW